MRANLNDQLKRVASVYPKGSVVKSPTSPHAMTVTGYTIENKVIMLDCAYRDADQNRITQTLPLDNIRLILPAGFNAA